jgi:hypothetical protein
LQTRFALCARRSRSTRLLQRRSSREAFPKARHNIRRARTLREGRERRGLELGDVEQATKIRSRYLAALEEERFQQLPGGSCSKGFLRSYAEFPSLEGQLYARLCGMQRAPTSTGPDLAGFDRASASLQEESLADDPHVEPPRVHCCHRRFEGLRFNW